MTKEQYETHQFWLHRNAAGCYSIAICRKCGYKFDQSFFEFNPNGIVTESCEDRVAAQVAERLIDEQPF